MPEAKLRLGVEKEAKTFRRHVEAAERLLKALPASKRAKAVREMGNLAPLGPDSTMMERPSPSAG